MKKPKYEKPVASNLSAVLPAEGNSCFQGSPEYEMGDCVVNGAVAIFACGPGGIVAPGVSCIDGGLAGGSCLNGYTAG